jgi:hypothetical protein
LLEVISHGFQQKSPQFLSHPSTIPPHCIDTLGQTNKSFIGGKMSQNNFFFRTVGVLLLIGLVAVDGFLAFQAGIAQGLAQAPVVSNASQGEQIIVHPGYGFSHWFGFPPFFGFCISILFVFIFLGLIRFMFCGARRWHKDEPASTAADIKPTL